MSDPRLLDMETTTNAAPTKLTAGKFRALCDSVSYWRESLSGARASEVARESEKLQHTLAALETAQLARRNPELEQIRDMVIKAARRTLASRTPVTLTLPGYEVELIIQALGYAACYMPDAPEQQLDAIRQALRAALATGAVQS